LKKTAAVGIDGITWHDYGQALEENLIDLHGRIHRCGRRRERRLIWAV
jgi:RNA-directed DNA polymerase